MRKMFLLLASLAFFISNVLVPTAQGYTNKEVRSYDKFEVMQSINYVVYSLSKMISHNDKIVLTYEYENVINNLNLDSFNDFKLIELLTSLMDTLTEDIISARQQERIRERYKKLIKRALFNSLSSININLNPVNFASSIATTVVSAGTVYMNYQNQMEDYKDAMDDATTTLEDHRIRYLNNMRTELLTISWELLKKYNISDKYRLTEKQINEFIESTKNRDPDLKLRILQRLLKDNPAFEEFPEFWYQYALATNNSHSLSNDKVLDLLFHFDRTYKNLFRRYSVYASVAMERIMLLPNSSPQINKDLEIILDNSTNQDWQNYLFAGVKYAELGDLEKARKMFQRNIDNGNEASLNARLLSETFDVEGSSYRDLLEKMLTDNRVSNADKLYMIGKARNIDYLNRFKKQIEAIQIQAKESRNPTHHGPLYFVTVPLDWLLEEEPFSLELSFENRLEGRTFNSFDDVDTHKIDKEKAEIILILNDRGSFIGGKAADSLKLRIIHPLIELDLKYSKLPDERGFWEKASTYIPYRRSTLAYYCLQSIKYNEELYFIHDGKFQKR